MKSQASIIIVQNFGLLQYTFSSYLTENPVVKFKLNIITVFHQLIKILSVCLKNASVKNWRLLTERSDVLVYLECYAVFLYFEFNVVFM